MPEHYILALDEAGYLGYADQDENAPGEFGLAAGVLYRASAKQLIHDTLSTAGLSATAGKKLHITDLPPDQQSQLRAVVAELAEKVGAVVFYSAASIRGHYTHHRANMAAATKAQAARKSPIRLSGENNFSAPRILEEVYRNVILEAIAWCVDAHAGDYVLSVSCDRTDSDLLSSLQDSITDILRPSYASTTGQTGFHPPTKKVVRGSINVRCDFPPELHIPCTSDNLKIEETALSPWTALVPDTVANWISYLLRQQIERDPDTPLNDGRALGDFPLKTRMWAIQQARGAPNLMDQLYGRKTPTGLDEVE